MSFNKKDLIGPSADRIIKAKNRAQNLDYDLVIHTVDGDLRMDMFESLETVSEYASSYFNYRFVNFVMGLGTYSKYIKKNRDGILVTLIKKVNGNIKFQEVYRGYLVGGDDIADINGDYDYTKLDQSGMKRVTLQLINQEIELMRTLRVDGVYTNTTIKDLLIGIFKNAIKNTKFDGKELDIGINIEDPHNMTKYNHIVLPTGLELLTLPTFLQDKEYGVYDGDIGVYLRKILVDDELKLNLFIYPLYTLPDTITNELHIHHTGNPFYDEIDNTYKYENGILDIINTSNIELLDSGENEESDKGTILTSSDPSVLLTHNSAVSGSNVHHKAKTQLSASKTYDKVDNVNMDNYVNNEVNLHKHRSYINERGTLVVSVTWNHSDETLLRPGMVTTLHYQKDNELKKLRGRLFSTITVYNESTKTMSTQLILKVRRENEES